MIDVIINDDGIIFAMDKNVTVFDRRLSGGYSSNPHIAIIR